VAATRTRFVASSSPSARASRLLLADARFALATRRTPSRRHACAPGGGCRGSGGEGCSVWLYRIATNVTRTSPPWRGRAWTSRPTTAAGSPITPQSRQTPFGANRYGVIANVGFGAEQQVGGRDRDEHIQTAPTGLPGECWAPMGILASDAVYPSAYNFSRNQFLAATPSSSGGRGTPM
jgi:hypothetical protein